MAEKDLKQKLRMERALWGAGYYTRTNVRLASASNSGPRNKPALTELTDVDVVGIKFYEDLIPRYLAVDCKSGKNVSPIGRSFWLAGVMSHFGAERGYAVQARTIPEHHREAAAKLGVTLLHENDIPQFESRYPTVTDDLRVGEEAAHKYLEGNLSKLSSDLDDLVRFRETMFWFRQAPRAMTESIAITRRVREKLDMRNRLHRALVMDVACLFSLASVTVAGNLLRLGTDDVLGALRSLIFGGHESIHRREQMIQRLRKMWELAQKGQAELPSEETDIFQLDPPYLPSIADAITRIMDRPIEAVQAPRYLKARLMNGVLYDDWRIAELLSDQYSLLSDKLALDLLLVFVKACGFSKTEIDELHISLHPPEPAPKE